jgi:hypothetical protein
MPKQKSRIANTHHPSRIVDITLVASAVVVVVFTLYRMLGVDFCARVARASGLCG